MTRPNIVRADTLDLQDQDNPTAAEHQKPQIEGGLAPHQRAEVQHVLQERDSEEHALEDAWNIAGSLTEEPGAIDQAQYDNADGEPTVNGTQHESQENGGGESETDADDDMIDRISSSPSIDDGGYLPHSSPPPSARALARVKWPVRSSSLSPSPRDTPTPMRETFNQSASSTPISSSFVQTPQHLPLHLRRTGREASPLVQEMDTASNSSDGSPTHLPTVTINGSEGLFSPSLKHHHSTGRYVESPVPDQGPLLEIEEAPDEGYDGEETTTRTRNDQSAGHQNRDTENDQDSGSSVLVHYLEPRMRPIESPFRRHSFTGNRKDSMNGDLEPSPSLTSIGSVDLQDVLLPVDDPLLDHPPSPTDTEDSWESLASSDSGSLDESTDDDDTDALFLDLDNLFIDSGWGGECLRETEDIDFEFVYALHTFVATVEGQANATKGDTMVLLDDSNSYWWLVRVVKDSSIGTLTFTVVSSRYCATDETFRLPTSGAH